MHTNIIYNIYSKKGIKLEKEVCKQYERLVHNNHIECKKWKKFKKDDKDSIKKDTVSEYQFM